MLAPFCMTNGFNIIKGTIPKIGSKIEMSILKKINANAKSSKGIYSDSWSIPYLLYKKA
jgi:hypothetical protein